MKEQAVGRVLWRAAEDGEFRRRALANLGTALAEEGFILTDAEMAALRSCWEPLAGLAERAAYERIAALARGHRRE